MVLRGKVRLTLKEDATSPPKYSRDYDQHAIVAFTSLYHHTVDFMTPDAWVITINVRGNVLLGRRFADVAARLFRQ